MDARAQQTSATSSWTNVLIGLLAFIGAPFAVTGIYRVLPVSIPYWLWGAFPFIVVGLLAVALFFVPAVPRSVSIGIAVGLVGWAIFLIWLLNAWSGPRF